MAAYSNPASGRPAACRHGQTHRRPTGVGAARDAGRGRNHDEGDAAVRMTSFKATPVRLGVRLNAWPQRVGLGFLTHQLTKDQQRDRGRAPDPQQLR